MELVEYSSVSYIKGKEVRANLDIQPIENIVLVTEHSDKVQVEKLSGKQIPNL